MDGRARDLRDAGGCIVGAVDIVDCVSRSESPWFFGKYGFVLANPVAFARPVPVKGALGFFDVPPDAIASLRAHHAAAADDGTVKRDHLTGQFAFDGRGDRMCVCGHTLDCHTSGGFDCLAGTGVPGDTTPRGRECACKKFRKSRAKSAADDGANHG